MSSSTRRSHARALRCGLTVLAGGLLAALLAGCGGGGDAGGPGVQAAGSMSRALSVANVGAGGLMINEVSAASWQGPTDEDGEAQDWVELYNPTSTTVELTGYGLSNKPASPFLWLFPKGLRLAGKGHLTVWLSKKDRSVLGAPLHTNFNLDNGGDSIYLSAADATSGTVLVDSATPPLVKPDQTWCRMPSGSAASPFVVCSQPTFNSANKGASNPTILAKPTFSVASGFYASSVSVSLTGPAGATVRYTTDGSEPTAGSSAYGGPLTVATSTVVRAASFASGAESSLVETATYIVDPAMATKYQTLKAVLVAMPPDDLARFVAKDRSLVSHSAFEMVANGHTSVFKLDAEGSIAGQAGSDESPQRSMNVTARDTFGIKSVNAVLWPDKPAVTSTKKFRLRNGSNDWSRAHLRDQFSQSLGAPGPNLTGSSVSVAMFINGTYYGLMDLREREDENLAANNLGLDKDYVDDLSDPLLPAQEIKNGGAAALASYQSFHTFVTGNDMSVAGNYDSARAQFNPDSLAWDWAEHLFHANHDWPGRNVHVWRSPELDGRWNWHEHDMDEAFGLFSGPELDMYGSFQAAGSEVVGALLKNPDFRNLFINVTADQMNLMTPTRMDARLTVMASEMSPYIADFYAKNAMGTEATWAGYVNDLRYYLGVREGYHDAHTRAYFQLGNRGAVNVAVNDTTMGSVTLNSLNLGPLMSAADPSWTGKYYPGVPLQLTAHAKPGYRFVGWQGSSTSSSTAISHTVPAVPALPADGFSARWTGQIKASISGDYRLQTLSSDGVRVWLNGALVIDHWAAHADAAQTSTSLALTAGLRYDIAVEYFDAAGDAMLRLLWQPPGAPNFLPVPASQLYPSASAMLSAGLSGAYFANVGLTGAPVAQSVESLDFVWKGGAPTPSAAQFTAVFTAAGAPASPVVQAIGAQAAHTGDIVSLPVRATDPGGFDLKYTATKLPKGINLHPTSGVIFGRITTPGSYAVTVTVSNGVSTATRSFTWTVTDRVVTYGTTPQDVFCASEGGTCVLPAGIVADVYYGGNDRFAVRYGITGSIGCNNYVFGDPVGNVAKACTYIASGGGAPGNALPSVAITSPTAGASLLAGDSVGLAVSVADSDGSVVRVDYFDGATLLGTSTTAPFGLGWTATAGAHSLTARATDNAGGQSVSAPVTVSVGIAGSPGTFCAAEGGTCNLPAGLTADVSYGANGQFNVKRAVTGGIGCNNYVFGDPISGVAKTCSYVPTDTGVPGNTSPTVTLTAPAANAVYVVGDAVTLAASAADADGSVAKVEFFDGSTLLGTATVAPYGVTWTATAGVHALTARATDNLGAQTTSAAVSVTVNFPGNDRTVCANEGGVCTLPAGAVADVYYGANDKFSIKTGVTGSIGCNNYVFGDPISGVAKSCSYRIGVPGNAAPTVAIAAPSAGAIYTVGDAVNLTASAADSDGNVVKVEFFDGATLLGSATSAPFRITWTATAGVHGLIARATDNAGAQTASAIVSVSVNFPGNDRTVCALEGGTCSLPAGVVADVYYGANDSYAIRNRVVGGIACNNYVFGDPINGVAKSCSYVLSAP